MTDNTQIPGLAAVLRKINTRLDALENQVSTEIELVNMTNNRIQSLEERVEDLDARVFLRDDVGPSATDRDGGPVASDREAISDELNAAINIASDVGEELRTLTDGLRSSMVTLETTLRAARKVCGE